MRACSGEVGTGSPMKNMRQAGAGASGRPPAAELVLVAAVGENGVIGRDNALPWRLKSDLQHFRRLTMGKPVVMGRKTFLSIGRVLPGRTNIVITRDRGFAAAGAVVTHSLGDALAIARADAHRRGADAIMILGGAEIFAQTMAEADRLEITRVHARPQGDTLFPPIDEQRWRVVSMRECPPGPDDSAGYTIVSYRRAETVDSDAT
jgi:dihydrofolate reductase